MRYSLGLALIFIFMLFAPAAHARVFSFTDNWLVAYFRGSGGMSNLSDDAYAETTGNNTDFDRQVEYNFSGELGLALLMGDNTTLRLGVEGLKAQEIKTRGKLISNPANYIDIENSVLAFSPMATLEMNYLSYDSLRLYGFLGFGYTSVSVTSENTLNAGAKTYYSYSGGPYKESWKSDPFISYHLGTGFEYFVVDNATISLDFGWRFMHVKEFEYKESATVIRGATSTAVEKGDKVRDDGGRIVDLDFGGLFVGLMFKFYVPQLD